MHEGGFFFQAFVYLTAAVVSVPVAKKLGLGSVLGYLIAGIVIGPFVLGLIGHEGHSVMEVAEFGIIMMLFIIGLELQPQMIWKLKAPILGMGGLQVSVTALLIMSFALMFGIPWNTGLALGLVLALSSTAIVIQTLHEKGLMKTDGGQNSFSVLLFQDISIIPILALLPLLAPAQSHQESSAHDGGGHHAVSTWIEGLPIWGQTVAVLAVVAGIILAGKYLVNPVFGLIVRTRLRELFTAAALLLVIAITILMLKIGVSPALGTFLAGVVLAQSEYRHELETNIDPFKGLLLGLFFIAVGASIDFHVIAADPLMIMLLVVGLIVVKILVLLAIGKVFGMSHDNNIMFSFALAQGGEFAFVLFSFGLSAGVFEPSLVNPLIAVVAVTMALTPLLMLLNEKLIQPRFGTTEKDISAQDDVDERLTEEQNKVIIAGFGRFGSTVGRFMQAHDEQATYLDLDPDNVELLRNMGLKVFYGDASRYDLLRAAGAGEARLLIIAVDNPDSAISIARTARKHFPGLDVIARSRGLADTHDLYELGVTHVYPETLYSALRIAVEALAMLGHRRYNTMRSMHLFRRHEERHIRELAIHRHDHRELVREAKQRIEDLEELMLTEKRERHSDKELGWDASGHIRDDGHMKGRGLSDQ
ncbi:monovalent cation:proton antiporter-2 (CPA2) family protein [Prosthecochloris sp. HL-130-GSB]|jgi:monovalent cation:proton antiporter-2 (CPA2) family protein|uniref:monovalent cation:proton antiporter-2 (CPA2) family protein n=1 Tax=Prosthecochloris sp. HL-130-GSB TaxID=1974213 RepID=UPI000A1C1485|nr:monovalent cation:proton antiporter-2 (CPA2) family protein [Prosthecochloris sp. HL-130-GSB]ARM30086.1 potassium transporter [Prosthecochloris sp. HL-130-GSB]